MSYRIERLERKYKGHLRCEHCNKWTSVDEEVRADVKEDPSAIFLCSRARCIKSRPETFLSRKDEERVYQENSR